MSCSTMENVSKHQSILIILSFNKQTNMSRLRPFAYSTGVGRPHDTSSIQPSSSGTGTLAKQLQQIESDIHHVSTIVNFIAKESIDGSVQVRTRIMGSFFIHFFHSIQERRVIVAVSDIR